ncbi:MAG: molybdopterin-dependent oxidoreductase [Desulfovibrio sp.]|jgi:anaerobic selenocysteine-containing dehydrogenase/GMP synthase-like glutamine amidotransferase|nr:molybdopterin-dependent oxidoreductase [Desulfovibrio sp.]
MTQSPTRKTVVTTCTRNCPNTCGLRAVVEDGRLVGLTGDPAHPYTRGTACGKTARYIQRVYSPERVLHPLLRRNGAWERVSWDAALDFTADALKRVISEHGPEAVLYYQGMGERTALKLLNSYFFNLLGGTSATYGALCGGTGQASQNLDVGERVSHDPLDHYNSQAMILWGRNPASTNISLLNVIKDIRKRGGPVVLVDPAPTRTVRLVDRHIAPRPNSDAFLALAVARHILEAGAADMEFLNRHTEGHEAYLALLRRFTPEELRDRCDVSRDDIKFLAETLMFRKPVSILLGWGLHRHEYAHYAVRSIDALGAMAGLLGVPGGGVSQGFEEYGPYDERWWGWNLNPPRRKFLLPRIGEEILDAADPPVKMAVITASNPACMSPNSQMVARGLRSLDCVVYTGHFLDDTADLATVFLPATTFLEEDDVAAGYGHNYVGGVNKAIEPLGECRSEFHIFQALAKRFPFAEEYCRPLRDWLTDICAPMTLKGCCLEDLRHAPFRMPAAMVPYANGLFPTPSGKFRCLEDIDPTHLLPKADLPYTLMTIASHDHICSERTYTEHTSLPLCFLAESEARRQGLADGEPALLSNQNGEAAVRICAKSGQRPDIIVVERGGWLKAGHGLNRFTPSRGSRVGNGTPYYDTHVSLQPLFTSGAQPRLLVLQNSDGAPGGLFTHALEQCGARLTTVKAHRGEAMPPTPGDFAALVVLGGSQDAYDDAASPFLRAEMDLMLAFAAADKPVTGICLGGQLLARAHGGKVHAMQKLEFGFARLEVTAEGELDPLLDKALPLPLLMEYHQDAFSLPPDAVLLVSGGVSPQAFRIGRASYGFQFHLEVSAIGVADWLRDLREDETSRYARYREQFDDAFFDELMMDLPVTAWESARFCRQVARNWLKMIAPS